jgi:hypothetical protein
VRKARGKIHWHSHPLGAVDKHRLIQVDKCESKFGSTVKGRFADGASLTQEFSEPDVDVRNGRQALRGLGERIATAELSRHADSHGTFRKVDRLPAQPSGKGLIPESSGRPQLQQPIEPNVGSGARGVCAFPDTPKGARP